MSRLAAALAVALALSLGAPAQAVFHSAVIDEIMSGVPGDPNAQYVVIRMLASGQIAVQYTRLTAFNCDGSQATELLLLPNNLTGFTQGRYIISSDLGLANILNDFVMTTTGIAPDCGMVCWGAPPPNVVPPNPPTWAIDNPNNYTDCVAYGGYTGTVKTVSGGNTHVSGTPSSLTAGDGTLALKRLVFDDDNATDFAFACPSPANYAGDVGDFGQCPPVSTTTTTTVSTTTTTTAPPGQPVTGKNLSLGLGKKKSLSVTSGDAAITLGGGNGSADDPTSNPSGGSLRVKATGGDGFDATYPLPLGGWVKLGKTPNKGYKYTDKVGAYGPLNAAMVKPGKLVKATGKGDALTHTLATQPGSVSVTLRIGDLDYCMVFGGTQKFIANKKLTAKDATAPGACP
jgi:hypothetical protein